MCRSSINLLVQARQLPVGVVGVIMATVVNDSELVSEGDGNYNCLAIH